jgi:hypothetical protein
MRRLRKQIPAGTSLTSHSIKGAGKLTFEKMYDLWDVPNATAIRVKRRLTRFSATQQLIDPKISAGPQ